MKISTQSIKELRAETGAGILDAKKALETSDGDYDKALMHLREMGLLHVAKHEEREAKEGLVEVYGHHDGRVGVMLELNCETDFVARNQRFQDLAHNLALHIAAMQPSYVSREEVPQTTIAEQEAAFREQTLQEGKPESIVEKIIAGRMEKFYTETVVLDQPFVKDDKLKVQTLIASAVSALGEKIVLRRFVRYELGAD